MKIKSMIPVQNQQRRWPARFILILIAFGGSLWLQPGTVTAIPVEEISVLAIIPHHFGANTFLNLHNFDKMGWHVTTAGLTDPVEPCYWFKDACGVASFNVDLLISEITDVTPYDILAIMSATSSYGKNVYADLKESPEMLNLIQSAVANGLYVWATCGGVRVLAAADVISGRSVVGSARFQDEYTAAGATFLGDDHPPFTDGPILTAVRGNYYHHQIVQAMAQALEHGWNLTGDYVSGISIPMTSADLAWQDTLWSKSIGTAGADGARDICTLPSGDFLVTGYTWTLGNPDLMLFNMDSTGSVKWAKAYGGTGWEYGNSVCGSPDGGSIAAGYSTSFADSDRDIFVVKTDNAGRELWHQTYGGTGLDMAVSICAVSSGGYALCGYTECESAGEDDICIFKIDESGNVVWSRTFGGTRADMGSSIVETSDHGFIVAAGCGSDPYTNQNMDHCIIQLDSAGHILWWKTFTNDSGEGFDFTYAAIQTSDGGYLLTGSSDTTVPMDFLQIKTDAEGNQNWVFPFGGSFYEYGIDLLELQDGYLFAGVTEAADNWQNDLLLVRTGRSGSVLWSKTIGGPGQDWLTSVCPAGDGDIIAAGHTFSTESNNWNIMVCKIDAGGNSEPSADIVMPDDYFVPGSTFQLDVRLWNPSITSIPDIPLFVILDVSGSYFFWPAWNMTPG